MPLCLLFYALLRVNYEHRSFCLRCATYHVLHEFNMTWSVNDHVIPFLGAEKSLRGIDGDALVTLFFKMVHDIPELDILAQAFAELLYLFYFTFRERISIIQQPSYQCALAVVNVSHD